jgi:hypothetical protein
VNPLGGIANSLITVLTGTDPSQLQEQATAAEQSVILAVEVVIILMVFMVVELGVLVFQKRS